jgi:hypothetical protein
LLTPSPGRVEADILDVARFIEADQALTEGFDLLI